ncbi:serine/threonine-protein kinase Kist [Mobula hypostoma]|uniref:serine/threonine-protein kinase Kist n=1 Tax=Mobula hypostoma TaxID=723540 RepID=UPI002FC3309B
MAMYGGSRPRPRYRGGCGGGGGGAARGWYSEPERGCNVLPPSGVFQANGRLWRAQRCLGKGSSAAVYGVTSGTARAAVKQFVHDTKSDYGFLTESGVLEDLQGHRNIVTLYGRFSNLSYPNQRCNCILLELLDVSVSELLLHSINRGHSMWMIQHCARDVLNALAFIHHEGYVHADLKPCNILWSAEDECFKLIDFGLSFQEGNQDVKYIQTDGYRAPEAELHNILAQMGLESNTECTTAVDIWSLGIILLEMFSGIKLKETIKSLQWKANSSAIIDSIFASKDMVYSAIPVYHLRDVIKSMLHDDPAQRVTAESALYNPFFSIPFAPHIEDLVMLPTPVLRLLNVIDDNHLQSEEEYEDVVEDVREECQKFGPVMSLLVPKENPGKGQVFVEFRSAGDCKIAQQMLTGRMFDGKFVVATFYPLCAYKRGYLYHTVVTDT